MSSDSDKSDARTVRVSGVHGHARVRRARALNHRCCDRHRRRALRRRLPLPPRRLGALRGPRCQSSHHALRPRQKCGPHRRCCLGRASRCLRCARHGAAPTSPQQRQGTVPLRTCGTKSPRRCRPRGPRRSSGCRAPGALAPGTRARQRQPVEARRQQHANSINETRGRALTAAEGWPRMSSGSSTSCSYCS